MCLKPITIKNPSRYISMAGGQPLRFDVPCGQCAECKKNARLQWHFRTYHHVKNCIAHGGYVLYDTLTYRWRDVPRISRFVDIRPFLPDTKNSTFKKHNFMCFDSSDWRNFLKNLRRQLNYHYPHASFTYFLTSEYGTNERYTHRPHYHVLFFVNSSSAIEPLAFSRLVSKCWHYGRTDGLPYKPQSYVLEKRIFDNSTPNDACLSACAYVAKYITKDTSFQGTINDRLNWLSNYLEPDELTVVKRNVDQFHRQSQGFGLSYLYTASPDELAKIDDTGCLFLSDADQIKLTIPLPTYYKRKLYYRCIKNRDGSLRWIPKEKSTDILANRILKQYTSNFKKYYKIYVNAQPIEKNVIERYLDQRTFSDYIYYLTFYCGRCRNLCFSNFQLYSALNPFTDTEYNLNDWVVNSITSCRALPDDIDTLHHYKEETTNREFIDIPCLDTFLFKQYQPTKRVTYESFVNTFRFTENSLPEFRNYDKLTSYFKAINQNDSNNKQQVFDYIEDLSQKFKVLLNENNYD